MGDHVSGREAAERLGALGVDRQAARRALLAGLAGRGERRRGALLYDAARVDAVAERAAEEMDLGAADDLPEQCRAGTFVVRLPPRIDDTGPGRTWRGVDLHVPLKEQHDAARMWFRTSVWTRTMIRMRAERDGHVPFVATVGSFVALGADITGVDLEDRGVAFRLSEPGEWFDAWRGRRLATGAGGPWQWWAPQANAGAGRWPH